MDRNIGIVGLGYVGLPIAVAFGQEHHIIGFDINEERIDTLKQNEDFTNEVDVEELEKADISFTSDPSQLSDCDFIIVAVPTPINLNKLPDFKPLEGASKTIGQHLRKDTIVVYESTVYPGATEEICVPILERESGLKSGEDFYIGYSPERINPGDKKHTFRTIQKVVSGQTPEVLDTISEVYESVVDAGVFKASSLKVAEAAKIIENTQRDVNIALMNELAIMFDRMDIDTSEVLEAAGTKWNFLPFSPGLVGGHCISIDPYYLTHKSEKVGYRPELILSGRRINDDMGKFIATSLIKEMIKEKIQVHGSRVTVLGLTFKENVPDLRNSKVIDVIRELKEYGIDVQVTDPYAEKAEAKEEYDIDLIDYENLEPADAVVLAVPHDFYLEKGWSAFEKLLYNDVGIFVDLKSKLDKESCPKSFRLWRL
ncbi:nucleotide sugar dehydrogenase [Gracilibacillus halophilus YIM-C55.5]|uniref:Nucleotide sugar dehydrogenase n=1 Tax=Gracilibacillus halophilus YIM-C55.5 TaxID=1308866 RepID=N4WBH1_9BACI|nr:nucleotide sugar dehydrogenase [Gracilibacillus halophilus]ENH96579.1 nucleotide sugar dehydrogenase [Gracilibacillus halophilus YIM-C55.5]